MEVPRIDAGLEEVEGRDDDDDDDDEEEER